MNMQRIIRSSVLVIFMVGLALMLPWLLTGYGPTARAATLCVDAAGGSCYTTIQAAVNAAFSGDTINIAAGTYAEQVIVGSKVLTFVGASADSTFVDGNNTGRVFSITATSAAFYDLTIQNGRVSDDGGGIYITGTLMLTNVNVLSNTATNTAAGGGGGIRARGPITVTGGRFENNLATGSSAEGGAIFSNAPSIPHPSVTISGATFISNTAAYGGGISLAADVWLTNTQFISNTATTRGGGVYQNALGTMTLSGGRFERNAAGPTSPRGGGLYFAGAAVVNGTQFISNTCGGTGGGARINGAVTLVDTEFTGNSATGGQGGGLYAGAGVALTNGTFTNNSSSSSGGGLYSANIASVMGTQFISNTANTSGGGLYASSTVTLTGARLIGNSAPNGGGVYLAGTVAGDSRVVNSVFGGNRATTNGAALYLTASSAGRTATILHTTIASPTLGGAQAIYIGGTSGMTTTITNTIVASYTIGLERVAGTVTVWNTLFNGNTTNISGTVTTSTLLSGDPLFIDPANGDYHLGADSPAIDAGIDAGVTTDIDGDARPQGLGYDLGYDEVLQQCALSIDMPYVFANPAITLTFSDLGNISCAAGVYFPRAQPYATGITGHGVGADHFWQIAARDEGGAAATGFTAVLIAPVSVGFTDPKLCFYPGALGGSGWDCGGVNNGDETISRTITHFSDWAVGAQVGPTAVAFNTLDAQAAPDNSAAGWLLALLGAFALGGLWLTRKFAIKRSSD